MKKYLVVLFTLIISFNFFYVYAKKQGRNCIDSLNDNTCGDGRCLPYEVCEEVGSDWKCVYKEECGVDLDDTVPSHIKNVYELITPIAQILYYGALLLGLSFIVYSGYSLMVSEGNPDNVKKAKDQLTSAILGIMFIMLSGVIFRVIVRSFFGLDYGG